MVRRTAHHNGDMEAARARQRRRRVRQVTAARWIGGIASRRCNSIPPKNRSDAKARPGDRGAFQRQAPSFPTGTSAQTWPTIKRKFRSRSEEHTSELQSRQYLVCRLLLEKKKNTVDHRD